MGSIRLQEVTKSFPGGKGDAVAGVSLDIADGEFLVLVGPSGCGKSTLLRMIAGIEAVSSGRVLIDGADATQALPRDRDIAMVFQNYALYPHMTVVDNLQFGLKLRKVPKAERTRKAGEVMRMLRLEELEKRKPGQLSGGQRQRVAMGRAMVREPVAYLMDEPLSNLDAKLRVAMRAELARLHDLLGVTTIYVTHDQTEAMTLGQRVVVLKDGVIQQIASPQELYDHPRNIFVAAFIGSPMINLVEVGVEDGVLAFGGHRLPVPASVRLPAVGRLIAGIRPNDFELAEQADPALPRLSVEVAVVERLGAEMHVLFEVDAPRIDADLVRDGDEEVGDDVLLVDDDRALFTAVLSAGHSIAVGDRIELAVNTSEIKFFDLSTGLALETETREVAPQ